MTEMEVYTADDIAGTSLKRIASATVSVHIDKARRDVEIPDVIFFSIGKLIRGHRGNFATVKIDVTGEDSLVRDYVVTLYSFHISKKRGAVGIEVQSRTLVGAKYARRTVLGYLSVYSFINSLCLGDGGNDTVKLSTRHILFSSISLH